MKERVYLETSIISYLTARSSRDVVQLAKQQLTREWWAHESDRYELLIGQPVMDEIGHGDPTAVALRMTVVEGLTILPLNDPAARLAGKLMDTKLLPLNALFDAYHISVAAVYGIDFLLTWNCTHINNMHILNKVNAVVARAGFVPPRVASPETLGR